MLCEKDGQGLKVKTSNVRGEWQIAGQNQPTTLATQVSRTVKAVDDMVESIKASRREQIFGERGKGNR